MNTYKGLDNIEIGHEPHNHITITVGDTLVDLTNNEAEQFAEELFYATNNGNEIKEEYETVVDERKRAVKLLQDIADEYEKGNTFTSYNLIAELLDEID